MASTAVAWLAMSCLVTAAVAGVPLTFTDFVDDEGDREDITRIADDLVSLTTTCIHVLQLYM
jgi:hypothetical protein